MNIRTYGTDERLAFCLGYLSEKNIRSVREIILLPIPTTRDGITVLGTGKAPSELLSGERRGAVAVGYAVPKSFREEFSALGVSVLDVSFDEIFTAENARLTAIGALGRTLSSENAAPSELSIGIIGYGRIGKGLLNFFTLLGASPVVFTTRDSLREELGMIGVSTLPAGALSDVSHLEKIRELDIIFNTAPAPLMSEEIIAGLSKTKIVELASGNNFPKDAAVLRYASLPALMYPKSAGRVLADSVMRMLREEL